MSDEQTEDQIIDPLDFPALTKKRDKLKAEEAAKAAAAQPAVAMTFDQIKELLAIARQPEAAQQLTPDFIKDILVQVGQANAQAMQTALVKDNPNFPDISPFSYPEGELARPKPVLSRPTFFNGARERDDRLMPEEIQLYNSITETRKSRNGQWKAEVRQNGSAVELWVSVPAATIDQRMDLPALTSILRELATGEASDEVSLLRELQELKRQFTALQEQQKTAAVA